MDGSPAALAPHARTTTTGTARRLVALLTLAVAMVVGALALAPTARADAPLFVPQPVTDLTTEQVLTDGLSDAEAAVADLQAEGRYRLWAVYVDSFDGTDGETWSLQSAELSSLSSTDVLLAVAVEDRALGVWAGDDVSDTLYYGVYDDAADSLTQAASGQVPWSQAIVVSAQTLAGSGGSGGGSGSAGWVLVGVLGAGAVGVGAWAYSRRGKTGAKAQDPAALSTDELVSRSGPALVAIDDELRSFEEDLGFAEAQFGSDATGAFAQVLTQSKARVSRAFAQRRELDSATDEAQKRALATEILTTCEQVSAALREQSGAVESLRQEQANAPQQLQTLLTRAEETSARIAPARSTLANLAVQYPPSALATVQANPDQAQRLVEGAAGALTTAQQELTAQNAGGAVSQLRVAENALGQAGELLTAVERAQGDLAAAAQKLTAASASISSDIADASRLAPADPNVTALVGTARGALAQAQAAGGPQGDPLAALKALADAETALDDALAPYREHAEVVARAQAQIAERSARLDSRIRSVNDFIASRRGAVGPEARTELAEAIRLFTLSQQVGARDPSQALAALQQAEQHALRAQQLAERDVSSWTGGNNGGSGGIDVGSLVLGGILAGGGRRSSWGSAPRGGGYRGGGPRGGGGFGGGGGGGSRGGGFGGGGGGSRGGGGRSKGGRF